MPIYEFKCDSCSLIFEDLVKMNTKELECPHCGILCKRIYTKAPYGKVKNGTPKFHKKNSIREPGGIPLGEVPGDEDYIPEDMERPDYFGDAP